MSLPARARRVAADRSPRQQRLGASSLIARARLGARFARLAAGLFGVAVVFFVLPARLPGGVENAFLGSHTADPIARAELRRELHLGQSFPLRFAAFVTDAAHGDLGHSPVSGVDVGAVVGERVAETLALAGSAVVLAYALTAIRPRRRRRRAASDAASLHPLRRRRFRRGARPNYVIDDAPAPNAVPGVVWMLPLYAAVAVAQRFGAIPVADPHAAIASRAGASLLPAAALGVGLAVWTAGARRTTRDVLAAVLLATLVTEAVFDLPGLGGLARDSAALVDPMMLRGVLFAVAVIAVVATAVFVPVGGTHMEPTGGPSNRRRAAGGTASVVWIGALVVAMVVRLHLGLAEAGHVDSGASHRASVAHPFGTDALGRDVMARVLATGRGSLLLVVAALLIAVVLGTAIGVVVGFAGGRAERLGLGVLNTWASIPGELFAITVLAFNGRNGTRAALALALVAAPALAFGAQRRTVDALRRSDANLEGAAWLRSVGSRVSFGAVRATLATMFVGASRVLVAELAAGLLGVGPVATQTWSHEIATQLTFASRAPLAVIAPVTVALATAVALAGLGNAIRPARKA